MTNYSSIVFCLAAIAISPLQGGLYAGTNYSTENLQQLLDKAHARYVDVDEGKNADYIKALAQVPSDLFGLAIVTANGDVITAGDVDYTFSIQSCSKVFTLCLAMQQSGAKAVVDQVNVEPTGEAFNSIIALEQGDGRAGNPLVNAGAIATVSMIEADSAEHRWELIGGYYNQFAGEELQLLEDVYISESADNYRNRGIAHILYNSKHLYSDPLEATDVYTMQCSVGVTAKQLAVMASVLANDGVNPITGERCLDQEYVPKVLAVMMMAGFYDGAGVWALNSGLPAKTGVGGGIFAVVPGEMAIVGFAPPLDDFGNSVRAQRAIQYLSEELGLNIFGSHQK
ncbi:MAG: glutaminase A [Coraliomargarita sp.]